MGALTPFVFEARSTDGAAIAGARLHTYVSGTLVPKSSYSNAALTVPHSNPVVADANGRATLYLKGAYTILVSTSTGDMLYRADNVRSGGQQVEPWAEATAQEAFWDAAHPLCTHNGKVFVLLVGGNQEHEPGTQAATDSWGELPGSGGSSTVTGLSAVAPVWSASNASGGLFTLHNPLTRGSDDRLYLLRADGIASNDPVDDEDGEHWIDVSSLGDDPGAVSRKDNMPIGSVLAFAGDTVPRSWLACDGSTVLIADFPGLHTAIGTTFGSGNSDNLSFNLPDLRGRMIVSGGVTPSQSGLTTRSRGDVGGAETVSLTEVQTPPHDHQIPWGPHGEGSGSSQEHDEGGLISDHDLAGTTPPGGAPGDSRVTNAYAKISGDYRGRRSTYHAGGEGGSQEDNSDATVEAHENMPPFIVLQYAIKAYHL